MQLQAIWEIGWDCSPKRKNLSLWSHRSVYVEFWHVKLSSWLVLISTLILKRSGVIWGSAHQLKRSHSWFRWWIKFQFNIIWFNLRFLLLKVLFHSLLITFSLASDTIRGTNLTNILAMVALPSILSIFTPIRPWLLFTIVIWNSIVL